MKQIEVVAAIIRKGDKIFATQRGYGEWKGWWEFPGGKMEAGETPEEALVREIREELSAEISVEESLCTVEYDYPKFHLTIFQVLLEHLETIDGPCAGSYLFVNAVVGNLSHHFCQTLSCPLRH